MENKETQKPNKPAAAVKPTIATKPSFDKKRPSRGGRRGGRRDQRQKSEFDQKILDLSRVTRVMAGGKRMSFRACVAIGDRKGRVAVGLAKGADVSIAINKAVTQAKKNLITVPIINETIPHQVMIKRGASKLLFKPAAPGSGVKAGGVVRIILELAGVPNISSKIIGTNNKINNSKTTIEALRDFKIFPGMRAQIGKKKQEPAKLETLKKDKIESK